MTEEGLRKEFFHYLSNETTISEMTIQDHVDRIMEIIQSHAKEKGWMKLVKCQYFTYTENICPPKCPVEWQESPVCHKRVFLTDEDFK